MDLNKYLRQLTELAHCMECFNINNLKLMPDYKNNYYKIIMYVPLMQTWK